MANVIMARVDARIIHGQLITLWLKQYFPKHIVVADDSLAKDPFMASIYTMAVPKNIKCTVTEVDKVGEVLAGLEGDAFCIFRDVDSAHRAITGVSQFRSPMLNIGGAPNSAGRKVVHPGGVQMSPAEAQKCVEINALGIDVYAMPRTDDKKVGMDKIKSLI